VRVRGARELRACKRLHVVFAPPFLQGAHTSGKLRLAYAAE
jgi:hypothetical protein